VVDPEDTRWCAADVQYYIALVQRPRHSVLLVDDDAAIREALTEALVDEGFPVHGAQNARRPSPGCRTMAILHVSFSSI
jgi:ActR/RegA family two-component response regulator